MITFHSPITVPINTVVFSSLNYVIQDDQQKQIVQVKFNGIPRPLTVWSGADYVAAGDYTQAHLDDAITAILGSNPAAVLETLFSAAPPRSGATVAGVPQLPPIVTSGTPQGVAPVATAIPSKAT